jgi:hypothetical protein
MDFLGKTREEFIDDIVSMKLSTDDDSKLSDEILNQHFNENTPECWDLRTTIIAEWFTKKRTKVKINK